MAKGIGLSRKITLQWLNKAVSLLEEGLTAEQYKLRLNEYLSYEIDSPTVLRKTREILMHVWFYERDPDTAAVRQKALGLIRQYPGCDVAIHWCMLLTVYPVFADLCRLMGRIAEFNEHITLSQLKQKLYDEWGERSTLYHSVDKMIATMKELQAVSADRPGNYRVIRHTVRKPEVAAFLLYTAMRVEGNSYYSFAELNSFEILYPFEYKISKEQLMLDRSFTVTSFGGALSVTLSGL